MAEVPEAKRDGRLRRVRGIDATIPPSRYSFGGHISSLPGSASRSTPKGRLTASELCAKYNSILRCKNRSEEGLRESLGQIRLLVMRHGIPEETKCGSDRISLRAKIWKILLCVYELSASQYAALVSEGACWQYEKIENDAFRTLATDKKFREQVHEASILRVLNSFVLKSSRENGENAISYVQGMNALLAPFLYVMPELDAFHSFEALVTSVCPTYVQPTLEGVYTGLKLLGKCLKTCDPPLHSFLAQKNMDPALYALPSVLTLCACTPPLEEVLKLWDYYLCFGAHLNIVAVLSQIIAIRSTLMASDKPMNMLRVFQPIDSQRIIKDINIYLPRIPKNIRESLHLHTHTQVRL